MEHFKLTSSQQKLVEDNIKLVGHMAKVTGYTDEDNIQWGYYGLCQAAARFDESKGIKFSTYACNYIRGWICGTYLDNKYMNKIGSGKLILSDEIESYAGTYECLIDNRIVVDDILSQSAELRKVCLMLAQGYTKTEVMKKLKISSNRLELLINVLREELKNADCGSSER